MNITDCNQDFIQLEASSLSKWVPALQAGFKQRFETFQHGKHTDWKELLSQLPSLELLTSTTPLTATDIDLTHGVSIGNIDHLKAAQRESFKTLLKKFHPWRKGPFDLFGIRIDTEWRSDWKWERLIKHISPLQYRRVLDIGCGNGYHLWRMLGAGASRAVGIDPSQLFWAQFQIIKHFLPDYPAHMIPVGIEHLPDNFTHEGFDTIFCMGVLYHRRSPIDTLIHLRKILRTKGELVLETLVVDGDESQVLMPSDRYAQMRNVWFLPSVKALELWLKRAGFNNIRTIDINVTSTEEQRQTDWMTFHSLKQFLNKNDPGLTLEGYPAPTRAIVLAESP